MYRSLIVVVSLNEITYYAKIVRIITFAFASPDILPFYFIINNRLLIVYIRLVYQFQTLRHKQ